MIDAFTHVMGHYRRRGYAKLLYKPLPHAYARVPAQDDLYACFRLGALRVRCDLSCAIDLRASRAPSERRRRGLKRALKFVTLASGRELLAGLWDVLAGNLEREYHAQPIHSLAELTVLLERFSDNIQLHCAMIDGRVEAGIVLFTSANVWHAQYIASSEKGYAVSALDAVFAAAIAEARQSSVRYFDFGTSNENNGLVLNEGLYRFKSEFGGGGVVHESYELVLP